MHIARLQIRNFRNLPNVDVPLDRNVVILGENRVGKSNLLHAMRLVLDASLPDSARYLKLSDFWDGLSAGEREAGPTIEVHIDFGDFDGSPAVAALLTDYRLAADHTVARLSYVFRKKHGAGKSPTESDYEFKIFGGGVETRGLSPDLRRRICLDVLPALRDAESELATWRGSPLRPLIDDAISKVDTANLNKVSTQINAATASLTGLKPIEDLERNLRAQMVALAGDHHDIKAKFGFASTDPLRLFRSIKLLIDEGLRTIGEASLGSANLALLTLRLAEFEWRRTKNERNFTIVAVEEPEAHLHPHLQRKVFSALFAEQQAEGEEITRSLILTTHSPSIASVAPIRSLVHLRDTGESSAGAYSVAKLPLSKEDLDDLERYLDATRADMLFARGIIFVEGDAESELIPIFAETMGHHLDELGVSVCSVGGTNFAPYAKLAAALHIPFVIITDWDMNKEGMSVGWRRALTLVPLIRSADGRAPLEPPVIEQMTKDVGELHKRAKEHGIYLNGSTLETEIANTPNLLQPLLGVLAKQDFGLVLTARVTDWQQTPANLDPHQLMLMIGYVSKGRFATQLGEALKGLAPPAYITDAIKDLLGKLE
ncbi:AAA family ATPase [Mesorhizobium sp. M0678]|uniref:ATP-dependent nuclease n=1 Tax=Mesorhizobium sp. M0678 TaxID=2956985 RepID=UPI00333E0342